MNRKVYIGGESDKFPYWYENRHDGSGVSDNPVAYCFNCNLLDTTIYVLKNSEEGKSFTTYIEDESNQNPQSVEYKAIELLIPRLSVDDLREIIIKEKKSAYKDGYRRAQYDIRVALGFSNQCGEV